MEKLVINGGRPLSGSIKASGSKNSVVGVLAASLMMDGICSLNNIPSIEDVCILTEIFDEIGVVYKFKKDHITIDTRNIFTTDIHSDAATKMRASYYLIGALLAKFGRVSIPYPGGCEIGLRPIDQHVKGLEALGAQIDVTNERITVTADKLKGNDIYFDCVSVGATINVMMAAIFAEGTTQLVNAAKEPHIVDAANFLNYIGAKIKGAGTDIIRIEGVTSLKPSSGEYTIIPDQIEVGTYMIAAAAAGGNVLIRDVIPKHMETLCAKLEQMGVTVICGDDTIQVISDGRHSGVNLQTAVYPGFPTDLQAPLSSLLCIAEGESIVTENIYENRLKHFDELRKMGAQVLNINCKKAHIFGVEKLKGTQVYATDLRAGAALVIAALAAEGITEIYGVEHIDRGYESIERRLAKLGADIYRMDMTSEKFGLG